MIPVEDQEATRDFSFRAFVGTVCKRVRKKARNIGSTGPTILRPSEMAELERRISGDLSNQANEWISHAPPMPAWARWRVEMYSVSQQSWIHLAFAHDKKSAQLEMETQRAIGVKVRHSEVKQFQGRLVSKPESTSEQIEVLKLQQELTNLWSAEGRAGRAVPRSIIKVNQLIAEARARADQAGG